MAGSHALKPHLMTKQQQQAFIAEKTAEFITALNGRFKEHLSDEFMQAYLCYQFEIVLLESSTRKTWRSIAYKVAQPLFEILLEHRCKERTNGHHVAQDYCKHFPEAAIDNSKEARDRIV